MAVISLLTDFGDRDAFVGVMKGVIWGIAPSVQIADLTHWVEPQNILHGALILGQAYRYFPEGSVHLAVVDPGVGTQRRAIAARIGKYYFVGPDNGLFTIPLVQAEKTGEPMHVVELNEPRFWLPEVSQSFHGRDIFAPCAAHLIRGVPLDELGSRLESDILRVAIPKPEKTPEGWRGQILMADVFGNLISNISREHLAGQKVDRVLIGGVTVERFTRTFGEAPAGSLISMIDSSGYLCICVVNGNAQKQLNVRAGESLQVITQ
ncbi:MAG: SAM-dependent chlorinase/fluorinase [Chloroflexota bacterium]